MKRITRALFALALVVAACGSGEPPVSSEDTAPAAVAADDTAATTHADEHPEEEHDEAEHDEEDAAHEEGDDHDEAAHEEGDDHGEAAHEEEGDFDRLVQVTMTEFAFEPASIHVSAGETVRFVVANDGAIEHEFRMTTEHAAEEHIAAGHEGHDDESGAEHGHDEMILLVAAGQSGTMDVTFHDSGEYDIVACLLAGHFEAGMKGALEYEA